MLQKITRIKKKKNDRIDARKLAESVHNNFLPDSVVTPQHGKTSVGCPRCRISFEGHR